MKVDCHLGIVNKVEGADGVTLARNRSAKASDPLSRSFQACYVSKGNKSTSSTFYLTAGPAFLENTGH
jgi:hypothetical protein